MLPVYLLDEVDCILCKRSRGWAFATEVVLKDVCKGRSPCHLPPTPRITNYDISTNGHEHLPNQRPHCCTWRYCAFRVIQGTLQCSRRGAGSAHLRWYHDAPSATAFHSSNPIVQTLDGSLRVTHLGENKQKQGIPISLLSSISVTSVYVCFQRSPCHLEQIDIL